MKKYFKSFSRPFTMVILGLLVVLSYVIIVPKTEAGTTYTSDRSALVGAPKKIKQFITSGYHNCAITSAQQLYCAGHNNNGQLGDATFLNRYKPVLFLLPAGKSVTSVSIKSFNTCVITTDQLVYCAGGNGYGQLGNGNTTNQSTPVQFTLPAGKLASSVITSGNSTCVITTDQLVYCAGHNAWGQLGNGNTTNQSTPVLFTLPLGKKALSVTLNDGNICVITTDQLVYCAGYNASGQLGIGNTTNQSTPVQFTLPAGRIALSVNPGGTNICVLTDNQLVYCAGSNSSGQLGIGNTTNQSTPVQFTLPAGKLASSVTSNSNIVCAFTTDQLIYCAGFNGYGQLGDGTATNRSIPVQFLLPSGKKPTHHILSTQSNCALTNDQFVYCSGNNSNGELGVGNISRQYTPVQFPLPLGKSATLVSLEQLNVCVLTSDRLGYCAGNNDYGQLTDGTTLARSTPIKFTLPEY